MHNHVAARLAGRRWRLGRFLTFERHKAALEAAIVRCLYEDLDRITSDVAEKVVRKKCIQEL